MTKTINKVIVYYTDGTYQEIKTGSDDSSDKQNTPNVNPSVVKPVPDWRPDTTQVREFTEYPRYIVTCGTTGQTLNYKIKEPDSWLFTSTNNADNLNKYSITSTGNGVI
jgi:hypothetical protein